MKKILLLIATLVVVVGCKSGESAGKELDPNAKISIRPNTSKVITKAGHLTPVEIVQQTTDIVLVSPEYPNEPWVNLGISDSQKDLTVPKIMMWGKWIINKGQLTRLFIEAKDVIFVTRQNGEPWQPISDTLAYIPNATLRAAETTIKAAFADKDYDLVYKLFDEAYRFTPITGAEWLELKAKGEN